VTIVGLRRSAGVDGRDVRVRTHRRPRSDFHRTGSQLGEDLRDPDVFSPRYGADGRTSTFHVTRSFNRTQSIDRSRSQLGAHPDGLAGDRRDDFELGFGDPDNFDPGAGSGSGDEWDIGGLDEVFGVRVCDSESSAVQDAFDETSPSQVALRPLRRPLHAPVGTPFHFMSGYFAPSIRRCEKYCSEHVCLSVCPLAYLRSYVAEIYQIFFAS